MLAKRKDELKDVNCRGYFMFEPLCNVEDEPERENFTYHNWYTAGDIVTTPRPEAVEQEITKGRCT